MLLRIKTNNERWNVDDLLSNTVREREDGLGYGQVSDRHCQIYWILILRNWEHGIAEIKRLILNDLRARKRTECDVDG